jgi:hypothetical protein
MITANVNGANRASGSGAARSARPNNATSPMAANTLEAM